MNTFYHIPKILYLLNPAKFFLDAEPLDKKDEKGKYRRGRELNKWGSNSRRIDRPTMWFPIPGPNNEDVFPIKNDGTEGCWRFGRNKMMEFVKKGDVEFAKREDGTFTVYEKIRKEENRNKPYRTFLKEVNATSEGSLMVKEIFDGTSVFSFPKPPSLIKMLIKIGNVENSEIVLDFFAGSGSTAHAVLELNKEDNGNRKFISVQLPEKTEEKTEAFQAGYTTIADIAKERIKRVIQKIKEEKKGQLDFSPEEPQDLGFKVFKLSESNFKIWRSRGIETAEELEKQMALFTDPVSEHAAAEPMVYELMLKSGFDLNSSVEHQNGVYRIGNGEMALLIETVSEELIGEVIRSRPQKVIALDRLFEGNDQLKTNTALQMKDANIDFKTI
jgi:adenine-specific DNA-methyltransferase